MKVYRRLFWVAVGISGMSLMLIVLLYWIAIQVRQRIARNKREHLSLLKQNDTDDHYFFIEESRLLGQGGGGKVYEGRYDGIDVAIKKIVKWDRNRDFIFDRNLTQILNRFIGKAIHLLIYFIAKKYKITESEIKFENLRHECIIQHAFKHNYILDIFHPTVSSLVAENARIQTIIVGKYGWDKNDANGYEKRNLLDLLLEMRQKRFVDIRSPIHNIREPF